MGRTNLFILINLLWVLSVSGQTFTIKTNALYDLSSTLNLGTEIAVAPQWTIDLSANYNPWKFSDNHYFKHWIIQPEARYWFCEKFNGHFLGIHAHAGEYNISDFKLFGMKNSRYQGNLFGGGFSYGYQWVLGNRWNLEASVGVGYAHLNQEKFECGECGDRLKDYTKNYFGPTKLALSIIYVIK